MFKAMLAAVCLVLSVATVQAAASDHLKAAKAAADQGHPDEAIQLYGQALSAGNLTPAEKAEALVGRGTAYIGKSMIADAFERIDQGTQARALAIADLTAAIAIKKDDADVYIARAQTYELGGQHDAAIADFDAAYKLNKSPVTLAQRAGSYRAKGDYDLALADYTALLALDPKLMKDTGLTESDIYTERGKSQFAGGRYAAAAADFSEGIKRGIDQHKGDVLWLPYTAAWLHVARARAGENDTEELTANAGKIDVKQWPGTLIAYFLGQIKADEIAPGGSMHGSMGHARECNVAFFLAEQALGKKDHATAESQLTRTRAACNIHTFNYVLAGVELKRLGK